MSEEQRDELRNRTRRLCAERGLAIVPYSPSWWIVGDGVDRVVADLADVIPADLEPCQPRRARINFREAPRAPQKGMFRCVKVALAARPQA